MYEKQMNLNTYQLQQIDNVIEKVTAKLKQRCEQFSQDLFANIDLIAFDDAIEVFQSALNDLTNISLESFSQGVAQALKKLKKLNEISAAKQLDEENMYASKYPQTITVKKEREKEYDLQIENRWKEARSNFFTHLLIQKLSEAKIHEEYQTQIAQIFSQARQQDKLNKLNINLDKLDHLDEHRQLIQSLNQSFKLINQQFSRRKKECPTITKIIQLKLTSLLSINISYQLSQFQNYRYSCSAFEIFKVVHQNRGLSSVIIKGVEVQAFQQFIKVMAQSKSNKLEKQKREDLSWMIDFKPSKSLKLAINAQVQFVICSKVNTLKNIDVLVEFVKLFGWVSEIKVGIILKEWRSLREGRNIFQQLFKQLKTIERIKIRIFKKIFGSIYQSFTVIFAGLTSLSQIVELQFQNMEFSRSVSANRFLAMEQILRTIFENNKIAHLKLVDCNHFPILPLITTLSKISLYSVSFRRSYSFLSQLSKTNQYLRQIRCYQTQFNEEWRIQEKLVNELESLSIRNEQLINFGSISKQSPSRIKQLSINGVNYCNVNFLYVLFPKLVNLISLSLSNINFGHKLLCTIPSPHLEQLCIYSSCEINGQFLKALTSKWPSLRKLTLRNCLSLKEDVWSICEWKGLVELWVDNKTLPIQHPIRSHLRNKGIKVFS